MNSEKENQTNNNTGKEEMEEMQMREETGKAVWKSKVRKRTKSVRR